jgi:hypothetical protein
MRKAHSGLLLMVIVLCRAGWAELSAREVPTSQQTDESEVAVARLAARAFCEKFNFPAEKIRELEGKPLFRATFESEGKEVIALRWLGGGRGDYIVQVEFSTDSKRIVVGGGYNHRTFGPLLYRKEDGSLALPPVTVQP